MEKSSRGFTHEFERLGSRRRQISTAALAFAFDDQVRFSPPNSMPKDLPAFAVALRELSGRALVAQLELPIEANWLLGKFSETMFSRDDYLFLRDFLASSPTPGQLRALAKAPSVTVETLHVVTLVDRNTLDLPVLSFLKDGQAASIFNAHIDLLRVAGVNEHFVRQHVKKLSKRYKIAIGKLLMSDDAYFEAPVDFTEVALINAKFPPPPSRDTERIRFLQTPDQMIETGRRLQNCLKHLIFQVVVGDRYFCEWLGEPGAIIELFDDVPAGFKIGSMRLARNRDVPSELVKEILEDLRGVGIKNLPTWRLSITNSLRSVNRHSALRYWSSFLPAGERPLC